MNKRLMIASILSSLTLGCATAFAQSTQAPTDEPQAQAQAQAGQKPEQPAATAPAEAQQSQQAQGQPSAEPETRAAESDMRAGPSGPIIDQQAPDQKTANTFIGMPVYGANDEEVGTIDDLLMDGDNRLVAAVVSVGGFLGIGAKQVALTWDQLDVDPGGDQARLGGGINREFLEQAPEFKTQAQIEAERQAELARQQQQQLQQQPAQQTTQ